MCKRTPLSGPGSAAASGEVSGKRHPADEAPGFHPTGGQWDEDVVGLNTRALLGLGEMPVPGFLGGEAADISLACGPGYR